MALLNHAAVIDLVDSDDESEHADVGDDNPNLEQLHQQATAIRTWMELFGIGNEQEAREQLVPFGFSVERAVEHRFRGVTEPPPPSAAAKTPQPQNRTRIRKREQQHNIIVETDPKLELQRQRQLSQACHDSYAKLLGDSATTKDNHQIQRFFVDSDFPPIQTSLDGRRMVDNSSSNSKNKEVAVSTGVCCHCQVPAAAKTVQSDGPNYGRFYLACGRAALVRRQQQQAKRKHTPTDAMNSNNRQERSNNPNAEDRKLPAASPAKPKIRNPYAKRQQSQKHQTKAGSNNVDPTTSLATCNFFQWDNREGTLGRAAQLMEGYNTTRWSLLGWEHFGPEHDCVLFPPAAKYKRKRTGEKEATDDENAITRNFDISSRAIRQGALGNCWFLSALAVVAEKPYLIRQLIPQTSLNESGYYQINLCLDGNWMPVMVDSYLPVVYNDLENGKNDDAKDGNRPKQLQAIIAADGKLTISAGRSRTQQMTSKQLFRGGIVVVSDTSTHDAKERDRPRIAYPACCAITDGQLWPALVEKAYAKAHGSYAQLSGGFIQEGFADLTGAPTETIVFQENGHDKDTLWARLLSFSEAGFLMGVATSTGGDGLVGGHAYSVLQVIEVHDSIVGQQTKMSDFVSKMKKTTRSGSEDDEVQLVDAQAGVSNVLGQRETIRLVRIRNPWGRTEWKGEKWSAKSETWSHALKKKIATISGADDIAGDGAFFMSYEDMLERFHHMDVAKCQEGWAHSATEGCFDVLLRQDPIQSSGHVYKITTTSTASCWAFLSIIQPKKRSHTKSKYWYCDPSFLILRRERKEATKASRGDSVVDNWEFEAAALVGIQRQNDFEIVLHPSYEYWCVPFACIPSMTARANAETGLIGSDAKFPFRLTAYSSSNVAIEKYERGPLPTRTIVARLHEQLLREAGNTRQIYMIASKGALACVKERGSLYFLAINAAATHILSLKLSIHVKGTGLLIAVGSCESTHVVPPLSQKLLLVLSTDGRVGVPHHKVSNVSFTYLSDAVPCRMAHTPINGTNCQSSRAAEKCGLGSSVELTANGQKLLAQKATCDVSIKGRGIVKTSSWIRNLGASKLP